MALIVCLIFFILLSLIPNQGESTASRGWRAGKQLWSSPDHADHETPTQSTESNTYEHLPPHPEPPSGHNTYEGPPHYPDPPMEPDLPQLPDPPVLPDPVEAVVDPIVPTGNSSNDDFRLLIGIMSPFWSSARRQIIRHAYSRFPQNLPVDIVFVEGNLTATSNEGRIQSTQHTVIQWENSTYHDIMHLDCRENLNNGKTYDFLKKVGQDFGRRYTHVMKTDDDAFVNIPGTNLRDRVNSSACGSHSRT
jgi:hypothetical protein